MLGVEQFATLGVIKALEKAAAVKERNTRAGNHHPYEQRITGDGSDWGEIMRDAFDSLMSSASESCTPDEMGVLESHIAATLCGNENRISERLRGVASDMRNIGASSMTPHELFAYWAQEVDKAADLADFMCGVNPDGLPYGLTMSDDGDLLNWRGENYVREDALDGDYEAKMDALLCRLTNGKWSKSRAYDLDFMESCVNEEFEALYSEEQFAAPASGMLTAEQVRETIEKHWHDLPADYDMPEASALPEYSYDWHAIADELNVKLGSGTCDAVRDERTQTIVCSKCGGGGLTIPNKGQKALRNFCPNCGAKIRKAVKR